NFDLFVEGISPLKGMKLTDAISYGPNFYNVPFIVSEKIKNIFDRFKLPEHYYFPVSFSSEISAHQPYYLFYMGIFGYEVVNDSQCVFFNGSEILGKEFVKFDQIEDNLSNFDGTEVLVFNDKLPNNLDLFEQSLSSGILISTA